MSETTDAHYFVSSIFSLVITIITGALSMIASCIIIYVIYKSEGKLSTTYHRVMCGMSVADIIKCIAIILTTMPMPRELPEDEIDYGWKGARLGNMGTCQAQGFMVTFGTFSLCVYYMSLISFYTLTLGCEIEQGRISRCFEPGLHLVPFAIALGVSIGNILKDSYRPNDVHLFCTGNVQRGNEAVEGLVILAGCLMGYILTCFIVIIMRVRRNHPNVKPIIITTIRRRGGSFGDQPVDNASTAATPSFSSTKVILIQASAYVATVLFTQIFPMLALCFPESFWLHGIALLFFYSQGIFNASIYVSHKVYNYRRINQNKGIREVIFMLFCGEVHDDIYISGMEFVDRDIDYVRLQRIDEELLECIQFEDDSIIIENNDDGESRNEINCSIELTSIPMPLRLEINEDQEELDDSVIVCIDNDEEERSYDFGSE